MRMRVALLALGWLALAVAVLPPLDGMATDLFAAHMVQHLLLGLVVPGLLVAGAPVETSGRLVSPRTRAVLRRWVHRIVPWSVRRRALALGLIAAALHGTVLWAWHAPALYDAAIDVPALHVVEHASYLLAGLFLWWAVAGAGRRARRGGAGVVVLFLAALPAGALGALLALAPQPLYDSHLQSATAWGLTALEDQQLAGGIMWVPGGIVYLVAAVVIVVRWLTDEEAKLRAATVVAVVMGAAGLLVGCGGERLARPPEFRAGDPERGRDFIESYGCGSCHEIPGVERADGTVGPPLTKFGRRSYIAGALVNNERNLIRWISDPQGVEPGTAMPDLGVSRDEANDIAAYLHTLD